MTAQTSGIDTGFSTASRQSSKTLAAGRILSAIPALFLFSGGINALLGVGFVVQGFEHFGFPSTALLGVGLAELACALLYVIPQTSFLGALLMTAYLGGAVASHVRMGEPYFPPIVFAIVVWIGLALRDPRTRALLPGTARTRRRVLA